MNKISPKTRSQVVRFLRVFLTTLIPALLAYTSNLPAGTVPVVVGTAAGALAVLWRKLNPLQGTSQLWRFIRMALFTGVPQIAVLAFPDSDASFVGLLAVFSAAAEVAYRDAFPEDFSS